MNKLLLIFLGLISHHAIAQEIFSFSNYSGYILGVSTSATRNVIGSTLAEFYEIREECPWCHVVFLCNPVGIRSSDADWYTHNVLKVDDSDSNTSVIYDESIYRTMFPSDAELEHVIYMVNGRIIFNQPLKHFSTTRAIFNRKYFDLTPSDDIIVSNDVHASYIDIIRRFDNFKLLYLSDLDETLFLMDISTGNVISNYKAGAEDGIEFYCNEVADNAEACEYAREYRSLLQKLNRSELYFSDTRSQKGVVTISAMLQVHENLENDFIYKNELGISDTLKKGSLFANGYSVVLEFDSILNLTKRLFVDDRSLTEFKSGSDYAHLSYDNKYYMLNLPSNESEGSPIFSAFSSKNDKMSNLDLSQIFPPKYPLNSEEKLWESEYGGFLPFHLTVLGYLDVLPFIYDINSQIPVYEIQFSDSSLTTCENSYAQFYEDSEGKVAKYRILGLGEIDENYIGLIYLYCDEFLILDILNSEYRLLQRINLYEFIDFDFWIDSVGSNLVINNNELIFLTKIDNDFVLKRFMLKRVLK